MLDVCNSNALGSISVKQVFLIDPPIDRICYKFIIDGHLSAAILDHENGGPFGIRSSVVDYDSIVHSNALGFISFTVYPQDRL
ncbi:hypothetical protein GDO81_011361 [Engystomops pustulosus]|uniref:Uncharacterized protein n=1 Tax=Engystomops pustulosus TaxID=76066 RepID=A0AAV7BDG1_ENGPU|nr:hypothetical protein GDO81_011361 [Engystomops pustulosus]